MKWEKARRPAGPSSYDNTYNQKTKKMLGQPKV
jgi:hypothetical protein